MSYLMGALAAVALLALDQWVKYWTVSHLAIGGSCPLLPGFVELYRVHNYGAAWSSFSGMRWLLLGVTSLIVAAVAVLLVKRVVRHPVGVVAAFLILSGGLGNIIDRVRLGYVVDMFNLQFMTYPVFNVADCCIVCGALLGAVYYLRFYEKYDKRKPNDGDFDAPSE
jgi:signal peptidase II